MEIQQLMWALEELADGFRSAVYEKGDVDAALAFLTEDCALTHVPTGAGGDGHDAIRRHLDEVVASLPADLAFQRVTRTSDQRRVVEESAVSFVHDRPLPWLLPGVEPTGRRVEVVAMSVVSVQHRSRLGRTTSLIKEHRTLWDHSGLLAQLGATDRRGTR
jgi:carboxymethylenebutenolidase